MRSHVDPPKLGDQVMSETNLRELLHTLACDVKFVFNGMTYQQHDGLAMGSPMSGSFASIFVGHCEERLFQNIQPKMYVRYADDVYIISNNQHSSEELFRSLNSMHRNLTFTRDSGESFLDVCIVRSDDRLLTRVYRKASFTGLYTQYTAFSPKRYKINLIYSLFDRVRKICSPQFVSEEESYLEEILIRNGYPLWFIRRYSTAIDKTITVEKKQIFVRLPYYGPQCAHTYNNIAKSVESTYYHLKVSVAFTTRRLCPNAPKDSTPLPYQHNLVYKFLCGCGAAYVAKCSRPLRVRVKEHLPNWILNASTRPRSNKPPSSSITKHLQQCSSRTSRSINDFTSIKRCRTSYELFIAEGVAIKWINPQLCIQKDRIFLSTIL